MEAQSNYDSSYSSATNWTVAGGSLLNSITFESSLSSATEDGDVENAVASGIKSPLILCPPSRDSNPCEITIKFAQKHEVRQIYVRSTARVYEIYYATGLQDSIEYLCTVRCGIATRDEEVLCTAGVEETALTHLQETAKELDRMRLKTESGVSTNEDDWVEVKAPGAPLNEKRSSSVPCNFDVAPVGGMQDLYEATAEITDTDPCISITLKLLSLQDKGYLFVDEVYVFADPIDLVDSENHVGQIENSGSSSLMAMLVPTLLQLSNARDVSRIQGKQASNTMEKWKTQDTGLRANGLIKVASKIHREEKSSIADQQELYAQEAVGTTVKPSHPETFQQVSGMESKPELSCSHVERVTDQLLSRVSRIENLFLRFEEDMLKPIKSIDARLQQIEQKLEELSEKSENSGLPSCTRISAPNLSCPEFDHASSDINRNNNQKFESFESNEEDISSATALDNVADSSNASQFLPGLVVTAPEFVNSNDEEENCSPASNSFEDKPKQSVSIDDALASALAGFLSSTSIEAQKYTPALAVKAPEFSNEEEAEDKNKVPLITQCGESVCPSSCSDAPARNDFIKDDLSTSSCISSIESKGKVMRSLGEQSERTAGVDDQCQRDEGEGDPDVTVADCIVSSATIGLAKIDSHELRGNTENGEADVLNNPSDGGSYVQQGVISSVSATASEVIEESNEDALQNVLKFSSVSSLVDFEISILDVQFTSQGNTNGISAIESLLDDFPKSNIESPLQESIDVSEPANLISVEDEELIGPPTDTLFSVDINYYDVGYMPSDLEGKNQHDDHACSNQEVPAVSLI